MLSTTNHYGLTFLSCKSHTNVGRKDISGTIGQSTLILSRFFFRICSVILTFWTGEKMVELSCGVPVWNAFIHIQYRLLRKYYSICAPRVGLPPTPGPARFWSNFSAGSRDIACGVIYSTKYLIMWSLLTNSTCRRHHREFCEDWKVSPSSNFTNLRKSTVSGASFTKPFYTLRVLTMQAKACEDQSDSNSFSQCWCVLFTKLTKNCRVKMSKYYCVPNTGPCFAQQRGQSPWDLDGGPVLGNKAPLYVPKPHVLEMSRKTLKLLCVNIFLFHTILQIKGSIMPSSFSSSSPPNSPIILDSEASTIVLSDSDSDSDDSLSSSIFGFTCEIRELRAKDATQLEYKYLQDDLPLLDSDGVHWANVMHVGPVSIWSAGRKALVIKFNGQPVLLL